MDLSPEPFSPRVDGTLPPSSDLADLSHGPALRGGLDRVSGPILHGWALDLRDVQTAPEVTLRLAGLRLGRCHADAPRPDIAHWVAGARPGFALDLNAAEPDDLAAALAHLLTLTTEELEAPAPLTLEMAGQSLTGAPEVLATTQGRMLALLLGVPAARRIGPKRPGAAPGRVAMLLAQLVCDVRLQEPLPPREDLLGQGPFVAAAADALREAGFPPAREALLLAELSLAGGEAASSAGWLRAAMGHLTGPLPNGLAETWTAALALLRHGPVETLEIAGRCAFLAALLSDVAEAVPALRELEGALIARDPDCTGRIGAASDLTWWARLAALLLTVPDSNIALRQLCLDAWQHPPVETVARRGWVPTPRPAMRALLLLVWAAVAHRAGTTEALPAALSLVRELVPFAENRRRAAAQAAMLAMPDPLADWHGFASVLATGFAGVFGTARLPALHALLRVLGLDPGAAFPLEGTPPRHPRRPLDVAFAIGMRQGESARYRVLNIADALAARGLAVATLLPDEADALRRGCTSLGRLVVFRAVLDSETQALIGQARQLGAAVTYDIDDLVFAPELASQLRALSLMTTEEQAGSIAWLRRTQEALLATDNATLSTPRIAEFAAALGRPAAVVPNSHGPFERLLAARAASASEDAPPVIAYFSGTWTHHADFVECSAALRSVLHRHPQARFLVAGNLALGPEWSPFAERIDRLPLLPHPMMLLAHSRIAINLAPLEAGNIFCDAKSELKVFEAGLFGVPSIASPTGPYAAALEDGVSGLLAATPAAWEAALEALLADAPRRHAMGQAARLHALRAFSDTRAASTWQEAMAAMPRAPRWRLGMALPAGGDQPAALELCRNLATIGHQVVAWPEPADARTTPGLVFTGAAPRLRLDALLAADAASAQPVHDAARLWGGMPLRLLLSDPRLGAPDADLGGLSLGLPVIAQGEVLARRYDAAAILPPALDRPALLSDPERPRDRRHVIFFARNQHASGRQTEALGLAALRLLRLAAPDVEMTGFDVTEPEISGLPGVFHLSPMSPWQLAQLLSGGTVGLCLTEGDPPAETLTLLACGVPVVDMVPSGSRPPSPLVEAAAPTPEALCAALLHLLDDPAARAARLAAALPALDAVGGPIAQARALEAALQGLLPEAGTAAFSSPS